MDANLRPRQFIQLSGPVHVSGRAYKVHPFAPFLFYGKNAGMIENAIPYALHSSAGYCYQRSACNESLKSWVKSVTHRGIVAHQHKPFSAVVFNEPDDNRRHEAEKCDDPQPDGDGGSIKGRIISIAVGQGPSEIHFDQPSQNESQDERRHGKTVLRIRNPTIPKISIRIRSNSLPLRT